jgi:hypothetical protein
MTGVKDEHTAKTKLSFRRKLLHSIIAFFLVILGWLVWQIFAFNNAVRMAEEAGFVWYSEDPITLIRKDWRNALKKSPGGLNERSLHMVDVSDLDAYREMLQHLRPKALSLRNCTKLQNVNGLNYLTSLVDLDLQDCRELQNIDGLRYLTALEWINLNCCAELKHLDGLEGINSLTDLYLHECTALQNIDGLKNLTKLIRIQLSSCTELQNLDSLNGLISLEELLLSNCNKLKNVDGLKGLPAMTYIDISGCIEIQNIDSLKSLTTLRYISLQGCYKIPAADLRQLSAALPKTNIVFPDGTMTPPQE